MVSKGLVTTIGNFGLSFGLESGFFDLATEILEISFDSAINWSGMSVALVKMNKKIDNLQRDLDALLKADLETAKHQLAGLYYKQHTFSYSK